MMSMRLQIVIIIVMILVMFYIINLIRTNRINFKYALGWLTVIVCILVLTIFPEILDKLAAFLGIASSMNMLFFFGFCFAVIMVFGLSLSVSKLDDKIRKLSQEIAIVRKDMYDSFIELKEDKDVK